MVNYYCGVCEKDSKNQISHHNAHLESEIHLTKVENFKLKLEQKDLDTILQEYPQYKDSDSGFSNEDFLLDGETPDDNITAIEALQSKLKFDLIERITVDKINGTMEPHKYERTNTLVAGLTEEEKIKQKEEEEFKCV